MKTTYLAIIISAVIIGGAFLLMQNKPEVQNNNVPPADNVSIVDGQQIIDIQAKGGYTPRTSVAKAGIPTIIRFHTSGTFDCSSSIRIPSMGISKSLPQTGLTDIDVGIAGAGTLQGMCGMGMYPFQINFQN